MLRFVPIPEQVGIGNEFLRDDWLRIRPLQPGAGGTPDCSPRVRPRISMDRGGKPCHLHYRQLSSREEGPNQDVFIWQSPVQLLSGLQPLAHWPIRKGLLESYRVANG